MWMMLGLVLDIPTLLGCSRGFDFWIEASRKLICLDSLRLVPNLHQGF